MKTQLLKIPISGQLYTVRADLFLALLLSGQWPEAKAQERRKVSEPIGKGWRKRPSVVREGKFFYTRNGFNVLQDWSTNLWRITRDNAPCALGKSFVKAIDAMNAVDAAELVNP